MRSGEIDEQAQHLEFIQGGRECCPPHDREPRAMVIDDHPTAVMSAVTWFENGAWKAEIGKPENAGFLIRC